MRHLNYNHLLYFWTVVREGSIARASETLHLTPQTISGQLKLLDEAAGGRLFNRVGRRIEPSALGKLVYSYADEIFTLGSELAQVVRSKITTKAASLTVGITDSVPKLLAYRMIRPALDADDSLRVICREGSLETLLAELAVHRLDVVLSDTPLSSGLNIRAYSHTLGESLIGFFSPRKLARRLQPGFPRSLHGVPMLLPVPATSMRLSLESWFEENNIQPRVIGEFDDSALLKVFGSAGAGVFPGPSAIEKEICQMYRVELIGVAENVREIFYAISPERHLKHPAVVEIITQSHRQLLANRN